MTNLHEAAHPRDAGKNLLLFSTVWLFALAVLGGCATDGTGGSSPARETRAADTTPARTTTAGQIYQMLNTVKTNSLAAAARNLYPPARLADNCQAFLDSFTAISPDMEFRLEFEPFVQNLFLVDPAQAGNCYGCKTNMIYLVNGGRLITDANSQGAGWVLPIGPNAEKAVFILSSIGPQRTTIMLFDDPLHGQLVYDSFATPGPDGIDYLCGVQVEDKNHFFLHEGWLPSITLGSVPPRSLVPRTFKLSVNENLEVNIEQ